MIKPRKLTAEQEDDIIRRVRLSERCDQWISAKGVAALAREYNLTTSAISRIYHNGKTSLVPDEKLPELLRRYRHAKRVRAIWTENSRRQVAKEYGISQDRINGLLGMKKIRGRRIFHWRDTAVGDFFTMRLPCSFPGSIGYY